MLDQLAHQIFGNLFKPLLLFFYSGFLIPVLGVNFKFPRPVYQGLVIYLLLAIGWHGGEELADLKPESFMEAMGFAAIGLVSNTIIGLVTYFTLSRFTRLRKIDAATVAGYYGSDSAGTFVTCVGVLTAANIAFAAYMPVLLAVMEIPGCLVALTLISRMRTQGMDVAGNMPGEPGYGQTQLKVCQEQKKSMVDLKYGDDRSNLNYDDEELTAVGLVEIARSLSALTSSVQSPKPVLVGAGGGGGHDEDEEEDFEEAHGHQVQREHKKPVSHSTKTETAEKGASKKHVGVKALLHEVFLNSGTFLLFTGLAIGFASRMQGHKVTAGSDPFFLTMFQGLLCLFLLEMGMTAAERLKDLKQGGWRFIAFGLIAPNFFALFGILIAHAYSWLLGHPFELGTYVLFAVLSAAASYIAVPAIQRMAIPEASPTLPLAAALGLTFSYNVTIGIPLYMMIAKQVMESFPVGA